MDFTGGLAQEIGKLPAEMQPVLTAIMDRMAQMETQTAKDVDAIAQRVVDGLKPMVQQAVDAVNTITLTVNASVTELTGLAQRIDGATVTVKLGPE